MPRAVASRGAAAGDAGDGGIVGPSRDLLNDAWQRGQDAAAAGRLSDARRWQERARRLAPDNQRVALALATTLFRLGEPDGAEPLFAEAAGRHPGADTLAGLAACALLRGDAAAAVPVLQRLLSGFRTEGAAPALADAAVAAARLPGWCGLLGGSTIAVGPGRLRPVIRLDGAVVRVRWSGSTATLPGDLSGPDLLHAELDGVALLGSPLRPALLRATEGFVEAAEGGLSGWAWLPADPAADPTLALRQGTRRRTVVARDPGPDMPPGAALSRPRGFRVTAAELHGWDGPIDVLGADGRPLLGSPVDPGAERRGAARLAQLIAGIAPAPNGDPAPIQSPIWADLSGPDAPSWPVGRPPVDVVIPAYRGARLTLDCIASVRASLKRGSRIHVVEDASPDRDLVDALQDLARRKLIRLIRNPANLGFPGSANAGLRACAGRDAVVLNSDTLVPAGWIERLRDAAYAAPDIGSVTPLSNDATICSYPAPGSPAPDAAGLAGLDAAAWRANGADTVDIPTGVGFCMYLRHDCLHQVGLLREDAFAQGYGEENDWCRRAAALGWRHVAAPGVFLAHVGGASFGAARDHLIRRNLRVLNRLHPGYDALVARWTAADPLLPARRRIDLESWRRAAPRTSAVLVTHDRGGGTDRVLHARCEALRGEGVRAVVLRPWEEGCVASDGPDGRASNLRYRLPGEWRDLLALLRAGRPTHVELHHTLGHHPAMLGLAAALRVPMDAYVHDYAAFCPRIALVSTRRSYCGEPDLQGCEACIADLGSRLDEPIGVRALVSRSAALLGAARTVIVPSRDVATRMRRHFPGLRPSVRPWEEDPPAVPAPLAEAAPRRVLVPGAIGEEKGLDVLLACVRDARARALPIEFVVCGYTADDARLMQAGPVYVTGKYPPDAAESLIRAAGAHLAFIPSVWPETWCFALSEAWRAGLPAAVFDLGAQAERVRRTGRGWVLPLGLPAAAINDALIRPPRLAIPSSALHCAAAAS